MKRYNKLVRDKIPEIIEKDEHKAKVRTLSEKEYIVELDKKLLEEVKEYQEDKSLEEIADVLEVLYAICIAGGYSIEELEAKRNQKNAERGGFEKRLFLEYVEDSATENVPTVSDIKALKKWSETPELYKEALLNNVFCSNCGVSSIVDYAIVDDSNGIILKGKCSKCGRAVVRYVENLD